MPTQAQCRRGRLGRRGVLGSVATGSPSLAPLAAGCSSDARADAMIDKQPTDRFSFHAPATKVRDYAPEFYMSGDQYEQVCLNA